MIRTGLIAAAALIIGQGCAQAQMHHQHGGSEAACEETALKCATKATPAFAADGTLWLAWMAGGRISVASSRDGGKSFSTPVAATREGLNLDWGPDARPKIAVDRQGRIALAFSIFRDKAFNGQVLATRSEDGGKSFAEARPIIASNESQRFEAIGFDREGQVFAAWLDKRNRVPMQQAGKKYDGAALFFASSGDGGQTYSDAKMAIDNTCECCRLGLAFDPSNHPVVVFRNIFEGGIRDHAVITFNDTATPGEPRRVSVDDWQIAACPHHGPSLAITQNGSYHVSWFTNGKARKGLFYAYSRDGGKSFSAPLAIGEAKKNPSRPFVLAGPHGLALAWKEFDGERTTVKVMTSVDDGETWSKPKSIAETSDTSDHPLLVSDGKRTYLSWMTKANGYRFIPIEDEVMRTRFLPAVVLLALLVPAAVQSAETELRPFERGSWQALTKAHAGRPTIVHFWGVTCGPCKVELPQLGSFMKNHPEVDMVTISADFVPNLPEAARAMLDRSGLGAAENWIFDGFADRLRFEIDPTWQGDIPRTLLLTRDGEMTTIEGSAEIADLEQWSARQLAVEK